MSTKRSARWVELAISSGLRTVARAGRQRMPRIETIDGRNATASPLAAALERAGARAEYRGFVV